jgi:hypothetical protein
MKPLKKDIYREMKLGKKELTIVSIVVMIVSLALLGGGIALVVLGVLNPNGAFEIIWRVLLGIILFILGGIIFSVGVTMFAITRSMINIDEGNVADGNRAVGTVNVLKCSKCGIKLSDDAKFCSSCGEPVELSVCESCGVPIAKDAKFCKECGKGVENK